MWRRVGNQSEILQPKKAMTYKLASKGIDRKILHSNPFYTRTRWASGSQKFRSSSGVEVAYELSPGLSGASGERFKFQPMWLPFPFPASPHPHPQWRKS